MAAISRRFSGLALGEAHALVHLHRWVVPGELFFLDGGGDRDSRTLLATVQAC